MVDWFYSCYPYDMSDLEMFDLSAERERQVFKQNKINPHFPEYLRYMKEINERKRLREKYKKRGYDDYS